MADEDKVVAAGVEAALKPFAELLERIAGPAAEEFGLTLKDHVRVFRFKRRLRLLEQLKKMVAGSRIEPSHVPFNVLLPIIENASIEESDQLQDKWAAMLATAAIQRGVHPSFPEILKQLNESDVLYLDATYEYETGKKQLDTDRTSQPRQRKRHYEELDDDLVLKVAKAMGMSLADADEARKKVRFSPARAGFAENVIRLGLMRPVKDLGDRLTGFGTRFVKACRAPVLNNDRTG